MAVSYEAGLDVLHINSAHLLLEFSCRATTNDKEVRRCSLTVGPGKGGCRFGEVLSLSGNHKILTYVSSCQLMRVYLGHIPTCGTAES